MLPVCQDTRVSDVLTYWTRDAADPRSRITLRHLLTFTAGFTVCTVLLVIILANFSQVVRFCAFSSTAGSRSVWYVLASRNNTVSNTVSARCSCVGYGWHVVVLSTHVLAVSLQDLKTCVRSLYSSLQHSGREPGAGFGYFEGTFFDMVAC
jgi:hypothetical protein